MPNRTLQGRIPPSVCAARRLRLSGDPHISVRPAHPQTLFQRASGLRLLLTLLTLLCPCHSAVAASAVTNRAELHISGFGWLGNLELKRRIRLLQGGQKPPAVYSGDAIEDIAFIVLAKVKEEGYLEPRLKAELVLTNGAHQTYEWNQTLQTELPRPLAASRLQFHVQRGIRFYYEQLEFKGARVIPPQAAKDYFLSTEALLYLKSMRVFTPELLRKSLGNLRQALNQRGYENASVVASRVHRDSATGAVQVEVTVREGLPTIVRSVAVRVFSLDQSTPARTTTERPQTPYSRLWEQDFLQRLRASQYQRGYPDATAELSVGRRETNAASIQADLLAKVSQGTNILLRAIRFEGHHRTRNSVLKHFAHFPTNAPLDRLQAEHARERLARLGVFDSVGLRYDQVKPAERDIVYELKERKTFEVNLLFGYGAYDRLGGGFEIIQRNVLGLAHQQSLKAAQTFKSSLADYRYTVPEIFGENTDLFVTGSLLRREEVSFIRLEYGGAIGVRRYFEAIKTDVDVRYDYELLNAQSSQFGVVESVGVGEARASAVTLEAKQDRQDNPLAPRRGYKLFANVEVASSSLGGDVNYQRVLVGGTTHWDLGGGRIIHLGATHGLSFTLGGTSRELPFNKRFFPGGENSERGYQYGEAAPRNASGQLIGAESYLQGNAEFEQFLTPTISLVVFCDTVGLAAYRRDYPFDETLYAVGGGLRWKTVIGPIRLEYGHNLNPRPGDPGGTVQFSFGFPF